MNIAQKKESENIHLPTEWEVEMGNNNISHLKK